MANRRDIADRKHECVILYAEDDDATAYLFQQALNHSGTDAQLFRVDDGEKALAFLFRQGIFHDAPTPDLVVLDLNLPKKSGFEVLEEVGRADGWEKPPVVMFSTSSRAQDRERALALGAREFFSKAADWEEFVATSKSVCDLARPPRHRFSSSEEANLFIDYRLPALGIRIRRSSCQLIARRGNEWVPVGAPRSLPLDLPEHATMQLEDSGDSFVLIVWKYEQEHPDTDLRWVLTGEKSFEIALAEHA